MRLLITDLDNTLYDWVTFFAKSFQAMTRQLAKTLEEDEERLLSEFQEVHRRYETSEPPYALLELPSVQRRFPGLSRQELKERLSEPILAFNSARNQSLALYPGVKETLDRLRARGVKIVGHTEAIAENALYRLRKLDLLKYFNHLYVLEGKLADHPVPGRRSELEPPEGLVRVLPKAERKPNPRLLQDICEQEQVSLLEAVYIGDSLPRDVAMAKSAGVIAAWARYGTSYDPSLWRILVKVTHWSPEDVAKESALRRDAEKITPDYTLDSFTRLQELP